MNTVCYIERKNFVKYDNEHYLLYLNEQQAEVKNEETGDTVSGFSYTGEEPDGGTLIEAKDVTDQNRRSKFIAGLVGTRYSIDDQIALLANGGDTDTHGNELQAFEVFRGEVKQHIDELLKRTL